jgi:predicted oxidoreductase (fatty acid repression mutant protein)
LSETRRCFIAIASEYAIRKALENQKGVQLNGTQQLPVYADNVNMLGENINTMKKLSTWLCLAT